MCLRLTASHVNLLIDRESGEYHVARATPFPFLLLFFFGGVCNIELMIFAYARSYFRSALCSFWLTRGRNLRSNLYLLFISVTKLLLPQP